MFIMTELCDTIATAESINVYNSGEVSIYYQGEPHYTKIVEGCIAMIENAHEMPAFGVSLNDETIAARGVGLWVEFVFKNQCTHSNMTFEKLLIKVEKEYHGFNIIRYNQNGGYSGRCYFIDLVGGNMAEFYDILVNL